MNAGTRERYCGIYDGLLFPEICFFCITLLDPFLPTILTLINGMALCVKILVNWLITDFDCHAFFILGQTVLSVGEIGHELDREKEAFVLSHIPRRGHRLRSLVRKSWVVLHNYPINLPPYKSFQIFKLDSTSYLIK